MKYRSRFVSLIGVVTACLGLGGCVTVDYPVPEVPLPTQDAAFYAPPVENGYRIQVGDHLAIRSYFETQMNQEVVVRPDGCISLLLMGDLRVVGDKPKQLADMIMDNYRKVVENPDITVIVTKTAAQSVYVGGELQHPSMQSMEGPLTMTQAITMVGGFLPSANKNQVLLLRHQDDGRFMVFKMDIEKILSNEVPDVYLQRQDVVYVPKSLIGNINEFVTLYINNIIPHSVSLTYGWFNGLKTN